MSLGSPPVHQFTQPLFKRYCRPKTEKLFGLVDGGQPPRHRIDRSFRSKLRIDSIATHDSGESVRELLDDTGLVRSVLACRPWLPAPLPPGDEFGE